MNMDRTPKRGLQYGSQQGQTFGFGAARHATRRSESRELTYRVAHAFINDRASLKCIIKNISRSGAHIVLDEAEHLPPEIVLAIDQTGQRFDARVIWRREGEAGVNFVRELPEGP